MIIGKQTFPFYGIIIAISVIISLLYVFIMLKKEKINNKNIYLYIILYLSFSLFFGKIYTIITSSFKYNIINAGISSYGALLGVIIATIIFEFIVPTNKKLLKYTIISLPLTYGIGKIACFIAGCCYGIPYNGLFSVTYTNELNIPLFPIQLLEAIVFIIIFIICHKLRNNKNIIYITVLISTISKFLLDFLRYDHINKVLTANQIFSIIILIVVLIIYLIRKKK